MSEGALMSDKELCDLLRIQPCTMRLHLAKGPPRKMNRNTGDIRTIRHIRVGGKRRWVRSSVMEFVYGDPA
jgi:hypothetical protein